MLLKPAACGLFLFSGQFQLMHAHALMHHKSESCLAPDLGESKSNAYG